MKVDGEVPSEASYRILKSTDVRETLSPKRAEEML